jgi:hypothetical protein
MTTFTTADRLAVEANIFEKIEELRDSAVYKEYENTYEDGWTDAINEILTIINNSTIPKGQNPIQTRYGALYYETPYRGESTCSSCDGSCEYIRGIKHASPCQDDHNEQPK